MSWVKIDDRNVRHVWANEQGEEIQVDPSFYADGGTPIDEETGDDLSYVRTEILAEETDNEGQAIFYTGEYPDGGSVKGCSCGMADAGAPGHEHEETEEA